MNGILVVNKEKDYTSRDIVNILNKKFKTKKIGHTGTLDPMATGVLVICMGKYTKLVDKITCYDKEYIATIKLGISTDTLDITGNIIEENDKVIVDNQVLINTLNSFLGKSIQEVPKYAAVKVNGKKLYEYARSGEEVILPKREIEISEIELLENKPGEITFRAVVSKGTYIRSLIRDICASLGVLGTMSTLKRTRQGIFKISNTYNLEDIEKDNYELLTVDDIFNYPHYILNDEEYKKVSNGVPLKIKSDDCYLCMEYDKKVISIYQNEGNIFKSYFKL
jgi:tRNA pseudouridine55 synthase